MNYPACVLCIALLSLPAFAQANKTDAAKADVLAYASRIKAAHQALRSGDKKAARKQLKLTVPKCRGWEYDYLLGQSMQIGQIKHKIKQSLDGNGFRVESLAFTPDSRRLVVGSANKVVKVWDFIGNTMTDLKGHRAAAGSVAVSPDGKRFATGGWDGKVFIWDADTQKRLIEYRGHNLPNTPPGDSQTTTVRSICFSPDSKQVISVSYGNNPFVLKIKCEVKIWSAATGKTLITLKGQHSQSRRFYIVFATFSPDGKLIATGGFDKKLKLWDAKTGRELRVIEGHKNNVLGVAFSPDGKRIASASTDKTLAVWNASSGNELLRLKGHTAPVFSVKFSPDGKRIVSGCWDKSVKLWDAGTGVELLTLGKLPGPVVAVAISTDGKRIAAGGGAPGRIADATIWDAGGKIKQ